jgi:hypothetical protein
LILIYSIQVQICTIIWQKLVRVGLLPEGDDGLQPGVAAPVVRQRPELTPGLAQTRSQYPRITQTSRGRQRRPWFFDVELIGQSSAQHSFRKQPPAASADLVKSKPIQKVISPIQAIKLIK